MTSTAMFGSNKFAMLNAKLESSDTGNNAPPPRTYISSSSEVSPSTQPKDNRYNSRGKSNPRRIPSSGRQKDRHDSGTGIRNSTSKRGGSRSRWGDQKNIDPTNAIEDEEGKDVSESADAEESTESAEPAAPEPATVTYDQYMSKLEEENEENEAVIRDRRKIDSKLTAVQSRKTSFKPIQLGVGSAKKTRRREQKSRGEDIDVSPIVGVVTKSKPKTAYNNKGGRNPRYNKNNNRNYNNNKGGRPSKPRQSNEKPAKQ